MYYELSILLFLRFEHIRTMGKGNGTGEGWGEGEGLGDGKGQGGGAQWKNGVCSSCDFGPKCKCSFSKS